MQAKITNRLLAAQLKATTAQQDMVRLLSTTGATNQEIADVLDTTAATVATTLQRLRKKAAKKSAPSDHTGPHLLGAGGGDDDAGN
jgi:DNA-directed RNA polymerase specialized sigma24 family protein